MSSISVDFRPVGNGITDAFAAYHSYFNYTDDNGNHSTLGAYPNGDSAIGALWSDLVSAQNDATDLGDATQGAPYTFTIASGSDADALWNALTQNAASYNGNPVIYDPTAGANGYNSNSFTSGDLIASGYGAQEEAIANAIDRGVVSPMNPVDFAPGFDNPLPSHDFVQIQNVDPVAVTRPPTHLQRSATADVEGGIVGMTSAGTYVVDSNGNPIRGYAYNRDTGQWVQNIGPPGGVFVPPAGYVPPAP